jgi:hypothetical protein
MIISHLHRFLFVELPRTGSTAISRELVQNYGGARILWKHSTYHDFLKIATPAEKEYFVFSGIRNPLDDAVSRYYKIMTDHRERFTDPDKLKRRTSLAERYETHIYNDLHNNNSDFETFFLKYYRLPFNNWASMGRKNYDYIIRFENIQEDFENTLRKIGIEPVQPLPIRNATSKKKRDFASHYSPRAVRRARWVFGPFMKQWGYEFPPEWGEYTIPWGQKMEYEFVNLFRGFYWRFLRSRI